MNAIFTSMKRIALFLFSIWVWTLFVAFFLLIMPFQILCVLFPWRKSHLIAHYLNDLWGAWLFLVTFSPIRIQKRGEIDWKRQYIIVSNHQSYVDIPALHVVFFLKDIRFIGKKELTKVPIWGWIYRRLHIVVDRSKAEGGAGALKGALQKLKEGSSVVIFPEGTTRKPEDQLVLPFKDGAFVLAAETQTPILPLVLLGTDQMLNLQKRGLLVQPTRVKVILFPPIDPPRKDMEEIKRIKNEIYSLILQTLENEKSQRRTD